MNNHLVSHPAGVAVRIRFLHAPFLLLAGFAAAAPSMNAQSSPGATPAGAYHLESKWEPGGTGGWDYLAFDAATDRLYITRTDHVQILDGSTGAQIGEMPGVQGGHGTALVPELGRAFVSSGKSNSVLVFDLNTFQPIGEPVSVGEKPDAIIYDPVSHHVFAFNGESDSASVIDAATAKVVATISLGGSPEYAAADGKGSVFVNLEDKSETLAIDVATNTVTHRWPLAPGESPSGLSVDPLHHHVFAGCHDQKMIVLDTETGAVAGQVPIGKGVDATAYDPGTEMAFASNGDGTLTVAQADAAGQFKVVENVSTQVGARTMALDPKTHAVYLATANFEPAPTPAAGEPRQRPKMVPGTFTVLKFVR